MPLDFPSPSTAKLNPHFILGEVIDHIRDISDEHPNVDVGLLRRLLIDVRNHQVDPERTIRRYLNAFRATNSLQAAINQLDAGTKSKILAFADGKSATEVTTVKGFEPKPSLSSQRRFRFLDFFHRLVHDHDHDHINGATNGDVSAPAASFKAAPGLPIVYEDKAKTEIMEVYANVPFENWGLNVDNTPCLTFVPTKVLGLQNLVRYAIENKKRVRCAGYRHSWSPVFSDNNEILVSMINLKQATELPDPHVILPNAASNLTNELKTIELVAEPESGAKTALVRVGAAVTTEEFRRWAVGTGKWTLPVDVILGEVTMGGTNGTICHGGGHRHRTINDQVRAIAYVDATATHRMITDPAQLRAAAGAFGLLGIVTHITYEVDSMSYAVMNPVKVDMGLAIPPMSRDDIPLALQKSFTDAQFSAAIAEFESRADQDFYSEWFWFAYQSTAWINTWSTTTDPKGSRDYTNPAETFLQWVQTWLGGVITSTKIYRAIPGRWQAQLLATATMAALPPTHFDLEEDGEIITMLPNALHFRRDDQNMRVRDCEFEIPIPGLPTNPDKPDWSVVRKAWWDVVKLVYSSVESPLRLCLELRIMADSDLVMAPQRGNVGKGKHGTASIEILTIPDAVDDDEWLPFVQKVADGWMKLGEEGEVRPHWGKEWADLTLSSLPAPQYLRQIAYRDAIPEFKSLLAEIGKQQDWTLADLKKRFSNRLWDEVVLFDV